jgi:type II secretion system protein G
MKNKKGFTLIELLVVIAIIGLLSTLAVISLTGARSKARDARRTSDMRAIQSALELYRTDNSDNLPTVTTTAGFYLVNSWDGAAATSMKTLLGNYLSPLPKDPDTTKVYAYCQNGSKYLLAAVLENNATAPGISCGATGNTITYNQSGNPCVNSANTVGTPSNVGVGATALNCADTATPQGHLTNFCLGSCTQ